MLLKVYCSSISAGAAGTFQVRPIKKKGKHGKYSVEVHNGKLVHSIWKEYGSYNISLLMPE